MTSLAKDDRVYDVVRETPTRLVVREHENPEREFSIAKNKLHFYGFRVVGEQTDGQVRRARRNAVIIEEYLAGDPLNAIAERHGITTVRVSQILRDAGVWRGGKALSRRQERDREMVRLYTEEGLTLAEIGDKYGITRERVRQILAPYGVTARTRRRTEWIPTPQEQALIRQWIAEGMSYKEVAEKLNPEHHRRMASALRVKEWYNNNVDAIERLERTAKKISGHRQWPNERLIAVLRDVARQTGKTPTIASYQRLLKRGLVIGPTSPIFMRAFGSWSNAVRAAGFEPVEAADYYGWAARTYSDEDVIESLERIRDQVGHLPSIAEYERHMVRGVDPSSATLRLRYGSWINVLKLIA